MQSDDLNKVLREHLERTSTSWSDEFWLRNNAIDNSSVMQYFYLSIFYDATANNERTKEDLTQLKGMRGLEYALVHSIPDLGIFHIKKQYRQNEKKVTPIALYYVLSGKIYEAPSVHRVFSVKLRNAGFALNQALNQLTQSFNLSES